MTARFTDLRHVVDPDYTYAGRAFRLIIAVTVIGLIAALMGIT